MPHRILGEALKVSLREAQVHREVRFLSPPATQRCVCVFNIVLVSGEVSRVARCWRPKSEMVLRQERVRDPSSPPEQEEKKMEVKRNISGALKAMSVGEELVFSRSESRRTYLATLCSRLKEEYGQVYSVNKIGVGQYKVTRHE